MKAPVILTTCVVLGGAFWGVSEQRIVSNLREQHRLVLIEAERLGVSTKLSESFAPDKSAKRQREDSGRKVRDFAGTLVAFAKEIKESEASGKQPDEAMQRRVMDLMDGMLSLTGDELKILISELRNRTDMDDEMRKSMIGFSIMMLAQDHPEKALAIFTESSDLLENNPMREHVLASSLTQWAKDQPLAAVEWMKKNADRFPELIDDDAKRAVISGVAAKEFGLAFRLASELKLSTTESSFISSMARVADTPERQRELLAVVRSQAAGMADRKQAAEFLQQGVTELFSKVSESGFDGAMRWLESAKLDEGEIAGLAMDLNYYSTKAETGRWLDWIAGNAEPALADRSTRNLIRDWTQNDFKAAGDWLVKAPAGPVKEAAVISYLETVAPYDSDVAAQWADTLPDDKRTDALKRIQSALGSKDQDAAEEFARRHGLGGE